MYLKSSALYNVQSVKIIQFRYSLMALIDAWDLILWHHQTTWCIIHFATEMKTALCPGVQ